MGKTKYRKIAALKTAADFRKYLEEINVSLPFDAKLKSPSESPLGRPFVLAQKTIGNRFCVLPMEGWDCLPDGRCGKLTQRRWQKFGLSGAKLIWGEACAVSDDARGHLKQLMINESTIDDIAQLRQLLVDTHQQHFDRSDDLFVGLQLSHAGRFCRPDGKHIKRRIVYNHPFLDQPLQPEGLHLLTDEEVEKIIDEFINAARLAHQAGFDFVDIKHCHGYLGHEFLSAVQRPGKFGGSFENRTRFLRQIIRAIKQQTPELAIGVRLSLFDFIPFCPDRDGIGRPENISGEYPFAFGGDGTGLEIDLTETIRLLDMLAEMNVRLVCTTAGSPYYNHHIQRPALFSPADDYLPPEDPLKSAARLINITAKLKKERPKMIFIGIGYSYLQQWLPHVAQHVVAAGMADFVGLGRMMLSYPEIVTDVLNGKSLDEKRLCRTIGLCVAAARHELPAGCYALDQFYKSLPQYQNLRRIISPGK